MWFIIDGYGTFVIDDEKVEAGPKDLIVVPPGKRVHYFGKLKMLLCTTPAFDEKNEVHIRDVDESESPYYPFAI
jgi:mannose-6-phosphate isomerase-like protein (cupin superfamily)